MKQPKTVPTMLPLPPLIEVPPMNTAASATSSKPVPWVVKKFLFSRVSMTPDKAPSTPINVNNLIRSQSTLTPTTRATLALSPMNSRCSPKRWRFKMNHINTASPMVQKI